MQYLVYKADIQCGPYSSESILQYLATGQLSKTDLCWSEGQTAWIPIGLVSEFQISIQPPPPPPPQAIPASAPSTERVASQHVSVVGNLFMMLRIAPYLLGILCFFLPFVNVLEKGTGRVVFAPSGFQLIKGTHLYDVATGINQNFPADSSALGAFVSVVIALALGLSTVRLHALGSAVASFAALGLAGGASGNINGIFFPHGTGLLITPLSMNIEFNSGRGLGWLGICMFVGALYSIARSIKRK